MFNRHLKVFINRFSHNLKRAIGKTDTHQPKFQRRRTGSINSAILSSSSIRADSIYSRIMPLLLPLDALFDHAENRQ